MSTYPSLKVLSEQIAEVTGAMQRCRAFAGTHGVLAGRDWTEDQRLERAALHARAAAQLSLDVARAIDARRFGLRRRAFERHSVREGGESA